MAEPNFVDFAELAAAVPGVADVERQRPTGFHVRCRNGWTVSVQCGPAHYCDNGDREDLGHRWRRWLIDGMDAAAGERLGHDILAATATAEIAYFPPGGALQPFVDCGEDDGDTVRGWVARDEVLGFVGWAARLPPEADADNLPYPQSGALADLEDER